MSRINTNVGALIAQTNLRRSQTDLQTALQRLSTGLRINRGADDPAGLIASESLRSEISGIGQAIANSERASNVLATSEGALNEVSAMLSTLQGLIVGAANEGAMSPDEIEANQLQVNSTVESITRIANTTSFAGLNLLNGNLSYITSGVDSAKIKDLQLNSVQFGSNSYIPVKVTVLSAATKGTLSYRNSQTTSNVTIQVQGTTGTTTFAFGPGTRASAIIFAVNGVSDATGVTAKAFTSGAFHSGVTFEAESYGSREFVIVKALGTSQPFAVIDSGGNSASYTEGKDALATVNGNRTMGDGLNLNLQSLGLDMEMLLSTATGTTKGATTSFNITGGGSKFQLGPAVNSNQQVNIGIRSVAASTLGNASVGYLSEIATGGAHSLVAGKAAEASDIVMEAIRQVSVLRGRLGAFEKNVLQTNVNSLQITLENVTASESQIRDADFAVETSQMTRAQILNQAGTSVLKMANQTPQTVLSLLQ
ncbi:MAG: flagellin [Phycisphaerae bacterium]